MGALASQRIVVGHDQARGAVIGHERADRKAAESPGQASPELRIGNATGEEQIDGGGEVAGVLQEKRPLFREEDLEALADRNLRLVGFDLAEVGLGSKIEHQAVFEDELGIQATIHFGAACSEARCGGIAQVEATKGAKEAIGNELHVAARRDLLQATQVCGLAGQPDDILRHPRPESLLEVAGDIALQQNAPGLHIGIGKSQALERHGDPNDVPLRRELAARVPHSIEAEVLVPIGFVVNAVALHAQRVDLELVHAVVLVEGVEPQINEVVAEDVVAGGEVSANLAWIVETNEDHIQVLVVIAKIGDGLLCRGRAIIGTPLTEVLGNRQLPLPLGAGLHGEEVFQRGSFGDAGDAQRGWLRLSPGV